nr:hypothetical protein Itr_chr01CG15820 [Ipomoea trifida]
MVIDLQFLPWQDGAQRHEMEMENFPYQVGCTFHVQEVLPEIVTGNHDDYGWILEISDYFGNLYFHQPVYNLLPRLTSMHEQQQMQRYLDHLLAKKQWQGKLEAHQLWLAVKTSVDLYSFQITSSSVAQDH